MFISEKDIGIKFSQKARNWICLTGHPRSNRGTAPNTHYLGPPMVILILDFEALHIHMQMPHRRESH